MPLRVRLPGIADWKDQVKCQAGCPVATDAGRYVQLIAESRDEEAFLVARAPNPFASVCGRVCAAPCEDACRRGAIDAPSSIRALKRFVGNIVVEVRDGLYLQNVSNRYIARNEARDLRYGLHYKFSDDNLFENNLFENGAAGTAIM